MVSSHCFSRVFDLTVDMVGRPGQAEDVIVWGTPGAGPCVTFALSGGLLCGIVLLDAPEQLEAVRALMRERPPASRLNDRTEWDPASLSALVWEDPDALDVDS